MYHLIRNSTIFFLVFDLTYFSFTKIILKRKFNEKQGQKRKAMQDINRLTYSYQNIH